MAKGPGITGVDGWRVGLLLTVFILITVAAEWLIDTVEKKLKRRKGLLASFHALKNELLYLGIISLLLSVLQVRTCATRSGVLAHGWSRGGGVQRAARHRPTLPAV